MDRPYEQIEVQRRDKTCTVRLRRRELSESDLDALTAELNDVLDKEGCRHVVLSLGPDDPECLYSVFLAKLVKVQRRLQQLGGKLQLAEVSPDVYKIFEACQLHSFFEFVPGPPAKPSGGG